MKIHENRKKYLLRILIIAALNLCIIAAAGYTAVMRNRSVTALSKMGSQGQEVRQIQQALKNLGYYGGSVDGIFGSGTEAAVKSFQRNNGLAADGIAGPQTLRALGIGSAGASSSSSTVLRNGSRGDLVKEVQQRLKNWGYYNSSVDGVFGAGTEAAVRAFQQANGLTVDGVVGSATLRALGISAGTSPTVSATGTITTTLRRGSQGAEVRTLQQKLRELGLYNGSVDGVFGAGTQSAVKSFQRGNGLTADGIVGPATRRALGFDSGTSGAGSSGSSQSDYQLLARLISAESKGEPYQGQVAVGAVILNRVKHPSFPDSVSGVCYQSGAFSSVSNGEIYKAVTDSAYRAATEAMNGGDPTGGAIYFYNPAKTSNAWLLSRPVLKVIANHRFCA